MYRHQAAPTTTPARERPPFGPSGRSVQNARQARPSSSRPGTFSSSRSVAVPTAPFPRMGKAANPFSADSGSRRTQGPGWRRRRGSGVSGMTRCTISGIAIIGFGAHGIRDCWECRISNCDIDIIGGSIILGNSDHYARYGNGIEFWIGDKPNNHNTVRNCQISRCFDTAMTIQGPSTREVHSIGNHFIGNRVAYCRQGFEHWATTDGDPAIFEDCCFNDNILFCCGDNQFEGMGTTARLPSSGRVRRKTWQPGPKCHAAFNSNIRRLPAPVRSPCKISESIPVRPSVTGTGSGRFPDAR